jgi:hypothetical protein
VVSLELRVMGWDIEDVECVLQMVEGLLDQNAELEAEVERLRQELAAR